MSESVLDTLPAPKDDDNEARQSQTSMLVEFVKQRADLLHDDNKDVYAVDRETREVRRIDSRSFRDYLSASFYQAENIAPRDQAFREALGTLAGIGRYHGEQAEVHLRVAGASGVYFLDLAEPGCSRAIRIEAGAWTVEDRPAVMFQRTEAMQPLPVPVRGGSIDPLWGIANVPQGCRLLVLAWLVECLRPDTPFPLLELIGEQGSAKSTTQAALRRLIDPNSCDLRGAPKCAEDIFVGAGVNWLASYENVSHLPAPMQDALCVLATGGGFAKRKLYSDADEAVISVKRPVVLNGISASVTAQDLIDRTVSVETPVIEQRQEVTDLWREFEAERPRILGALLDIAAAALRVLPKIHLAPTERPRLAEFARLGMAVAVAVGEPPHAFMTQFNASRQESIGRTIDASPVASAVLDWFEKNPNGKTASVKNLFAEVEQFKPAGTDAWPRSAKGFADALRRAAPALRQMGVECRCEGKVGSTVRWKISPKRNTADQGHHAARQSRDSTPQVGEEHDFTTLTTSESVLYTDHAPAWAARAGLEDF